MKLQNSPTSPTFPYNGLFSMDIRLYSMMTLKKKYMTIRLIIIMLKYINLCKKNQLFKS